MGKVKKYTKIIILAILMKVLLFGMLSTATCFNDSMYDKNLSIDINNKENNLEEHLRAYNRLYYDKFFLTKDWEGGFSSYESSIEPYAERATIAWSLSKYLESEVIMYAATKDPVYLNRVIDVIDKALDLRDSKSGRVNKYGESPPIWSSGSRYGWGKSILENKKGEEVVEVLTYGKWDKDEGIIGELRRDNDVTYITVKPGSAKGTYKIRIQNDRVQFDRTYDELRLEKEGVILDDNSVRITVLKSSDELPKFKEKDFIGNILTPRPVKTALIFNPIIELVEIIKKDNLNEYYQKKADEYIEAAIKAIEYHEKDWVYLGNQRGYYSGSDREIEDNKRPLPWNKILELGRMSIKLYNITGEYHYKEKVEKIINCFMDHVEYDEKNDLYIWRYWEWDGYKVWEGINYARFAMDFIYEAYKTGIGFNEKEMNRFINSYRKNIYRDDNTISRRIDGSGVYHEERWLALALVNYLSEWGDDYFFYKPVKWIEEDDNGRAANVVKLLSIAKSVYQKRILNPEFEDMTDQEKVGEYRIINPY